MSWNLSMRKLAILVALSWPVMSMQVPKPPRPAKVEIPKSPHEQARSDFEHAHPCPSTGRSSGACPGYVGGYLTPRACGGTDVAANMQWQTPEAARAAKKQGCPSK
jgi:hypothetical protein